MGKSITITNKKTDRQYTLEFNRRAVEIMERNNFVLAEITEKPMTVLPALFRGAFIMHHPSVKKEIIDELYDGLSDKTGLIEKLIEMYSEPIAALMDNKEADEGNVEWGASF